MLRIGFALVTTQLLSLGGGLLIAGGILLLYVCWKMYRELAVIARATSTRRPRRSPTPTSMPTARSPARRRARRCAQAVIQIVIADVSMSLDNVLAVAGAAQHHFEALIFGLALSVVLMGVAASLHRPAAPPLPLDRLDRPRDHPLCGGAMVYEGADSCSATLCR